MYCCSDLIHMWNLYLKCLLLVIICIMGTSGKNPVTFMRASMSTIQTPDNIQVPNTALVAYNRNMLTFGVKACNDAHLFLHARVGSGIANTEVYIGGWRNTRSAIRIFPDGEVGDLVLSQDTPNILDCHEMKTFWLSWQNDRIRVGRGPMYGQQIFLDYNRAVHGYGHVVNLIRIATGHGASGVWQIRENQVDFMFIETPPSYGYNTLWKTTQQKFGVMFFEVKACHSAHIAMSPVVGVWRRAAYEVEIGGWGNTKSVIRALIQGGSPRATLNMTGLLDCNKYKPFWVSWRSRTINFGKGFVYNEQELLRWRLRGRRRPIRSLGFCTFDGAEGSWKFNENTEPAFVFHTPSDPDFNRTFVVVPRETHFRFELKTCTSGVLYISPRRAPLRRDVIFIGLGFDQNKKYIISMNDVTQAEGTYEGRLDCERFMSYWITWENGLIRVGAGGSIQQDPIVQWQSPYRVIYSVGFRSPESVAHWRIRADQVDNARVMTDPSTFNTRPHALVWVDQQLIKVISIRGCSSASIALLNSHAWLNNRAMEVTIGAENNQKVVLAQAKEGGDVVHEVYAPNLLQCGDTRNFWISWYRHTISVGRGWRYGQNTLLSIPMIRRYAVQALRVRGASDRLVWRFRGDSTDYVMRNTSGDGSYEWMRPHSSRKWINFGILGCSSVAVALSAQYSLEASMAYEIGLDWGQNALSYIKKDGQIMVQQNKLWTGLNCSLPRRYWVTWDNGVITLGRGNVPGFSKLITWTDPQPRDIRSLGIASGEGKRAEWRFRSDDLIESAAVIEPRAGAIKYWATIRHRQSIQLKITTCKDFRVYLTTMLGMPNTSLSYAIEMAGDYSITRLRISGRTQMTVYAPYILNCDDERDIWISWGNAVIMVGKGLQVGRRTFLTFNDMNPIVVHAIGFASNDDRPARVRMLHDEVDFATVETPVRSSGLNGGQIAGVVIGVLLLLAAFCGAIYVIYRPPERVEKILYPNMSKTPTPAVSAASVGFSSPLSGDK